jgi:hypothetical protein
MKPSPNSHLKIALVVVLAGIGVLAINPVSVARFQQRAAPAARAAISAAISEEARKAEVANRKPLRIIRDRYALFSAVAVDAERNEVVLQDENMFRTLVYDRTTNTPPRAALIRAKASHRRPKDAPGVELWRLHRSEDRQYFRREQ